jgi:hypothetical protein
MSLLWNQALSVEALVNQPTSAAKPGTMATETRDTIMKNTPQDTDPEAIV